MEMDGKFNLDSADTRWHRCDDQYSAYDGAQDHWVAALQGRAPLIDSAALGLSMMLIAEGIYLSHELGREVTAAEVEENSKSSAIKAL